MALTTQEYYVDARDVDVKAPGALDDLEREIEVIAEAVEHLAQRTAPVRSQSATKSDTPQNVPRSEPANALRARIESLQRVRLHLEQVTAEIDL